MLIVVKVQGGKRNEKKVAKMLEGLQNPVEGEPSWILVLPWFTEFSELPRELIKRLVESMTDYLAKTE